MKEPELKGKQFNRKSKGQIAREARQYRQHMKTGTVLRVA